MKRVIVIGRHFRILLTLIVISIGLGCAGPDLKEINGQTLKFVCDMAKSNEQAQVFKIRAKQGKDDEPLVLDNREPQRYFEKKNEWEAEFRGLYKWFNILQWNSPEINYEIEIFIINGTSGISSSEFDGGDMPIANREKK